MRPAIMPRRFDDALAGMRTYAEGRDSALDRDTYRRLAALRDQYAASCERLATMPGGASLDHNDLHPNNVLMGTAESPGMAFYDRGDSVVAHPFASMLVPLAWARRQMPDDPAISRLRDAYLEPFADVAPHRDLVAALELACHVGQVARSLTRARALVDLRPEEEQDLVCGPLWILRGLLDDSYLAGGWPHS